MKPLGLPAPRLATIFIVVVGLFSVVIAEEEVAKTDPESGMIIDEHWQLVRAMCSSCHSPKLYTNYGATRETWAGLIDWMQAKQGLWEIPVETESHILDYLEKNYPPGEQSRRRNLPANLRPPNPYRSEVRAEYERRLKNGEISRPGESSGSA